MSKTILVLGGGIGGINTAKELSKKIGNEEGINLANILVFEREEKNVYQPSLTWLMVGKRKEEQLYRDTKDIEVGGIEVVFGDIEKADPQNLSVSVNGKTYKGDYMVVSLGIEEGDDHGLSEAGHNFYSLDGANEFYEDLKDFKGGKIVITVPSLPFKSPVAPYEAAMLVEDYIREKGLRDETEICLYTPESEPMGFAGEEISDNVMKLMAERGIHYMAGFELSSASGKTLTFKDSSGESKTVEFDLMAFTPKHKCPTVIEETGL
ncbi:MAG: FAD/NAD(P)-binding oxidoreductase, partial [Gracilimonas sp.]